MSKLETIWKIMSSYWLLALVILSVLTFAAPKAIIFAAYIFIFLGYGKDVAGKLEDSFRS
jgi:hypothetical protein